MPVSRTIETIACILIAGCGIVLARLLGAA
jgi:hypothetical protein